MWIILIWLCGGCPGGSCPDGSAAGLAELRPILFLTPAMTTKNHVFVPPISCFEFSAESYHKTLLHCNKRFKYVFVENPHFFGAKK